MDWHVSMLRRVGWDSQPRAPGYYEGHSQPDEFAKMAGSWQGPMKARPAHHLDSRPRRSKWLLKGVGGPVMYLVAELKTKKTLQRGQAGAGGPWRPPAAWVGQCFVWTPRGRGGRAHPGPLGQNWGQPGQMHPHGRSGPLAFGLPPPGAGVKRRPAREYGLGPQDDAKATMLAQLDGWVDSFGKGQVCRSPPGNAQCCSRTPVPRFVAPNIASFNPDKKYFVSVFQKNLAQNNRCFLVVNKSIWADFFKEQNQLSLRAQEKGHFVDFEEVSVVQFVAWFLTKQ